MKTAVKLDLKSKTFYISKNYDRLRVKETNPFDFRFYQKLFVVLISLFSILIFPESPRELENICKSHNSYELCNIW